MLLSFALEWSAADLAGGNSGRYLQCRRASCGASIGCWAGLAALTPVLRTAIAYPLSTRFRTGMAMLLFAYSHHHSRHHGRGYSSDSDRGHAKRRAFCWLRDTGIEYAALFL